ncbi:MAG: DUF1295 domain-containing protein [Xanthomonadales bacterium]|nr:DUF1295 domain-containing protein [Xanthomonadales bacterium]
MPDLQAWLLALAAMLAAAVVTWVVSTFKRDVSIVDSLWSLLFLLGLMVYVLAADITGPRTVLVVALVAVWALRLSAHIAVRSFGEPEDRRYQKIRANNQPYFWLKSLYIVFALQALLAWIICLPAVAAVSAQAPLGLLDFAGVALWLTGMFFEAVGDWQLYRFQRRDSAGEVLDSGLWRYTRHPNYFGEATLWWGIYLLAVAGGAWWTVFAPLLLTFLLLRVSGVAMLEKGISARRPQYRDYIRRTSAFFPRLPREPGKDGSRGAS